MGNTILIDFFLKLLLVEQRLLLCNPAFFLVDVRAGFDVCGIYKDFRRINKTMLIAFLKDTREDLFKKICILKASSIVLAKRREMRNCIQHI